MTRFLLAAIAALIAWRWLRPRRRVIYDTGLVVLHDEDYFSQPFVDPYLEVLWRQEGAA